MQTLVSVLMPSLNQAQYLAAAIDSVLTQDHQALELIVADGGSTDGTLGLLKANAQTDARLKWFSGPDAGPADALNKALVKARGTVIGWLNSDDLYTPGAVKRALVGLQASPDLLMVYGHGQHLNAAGQVTAAYPTKPAGTPIEEFAEGCFICQPTVFFKRTMPRLLGPFDASLKTAFDFDYWLRAFKAFPGRIAFVDAVQAQSRLHADCITLKQRRTVMLEGMALLAKHLGHAPKEWLLTYVFESVAQDPSQQHIATLKKDVVGLLGHVEHYLTSADLLELKRVLAMPQTWGTAQPL